MLHIKHGNPVVKFLIGSEEEVIYDKEKVSKRIAEYFQEVYKRKGDDSCTHPTWYRPSLTGGPWCIFLSGGGKRCRQGM